MAGETKDRQGRAFRLRVLANAIARHVGPGEWVSYGQIADALEELTGHRTTGIAIGSALHPLSDGGYVAFRVRSQDGSFKPFAHDRIAVDTPTANRFALAEGICDVRGRVRSEARLDSSVLAQRALTVAEYLLDNGGI